MKIKTILSQTLLVMAALIWGLAFSMQKAAESVPAFTLGYSRSLLAMVFLIPVIMISDRLCNTGRQLFSKKQKIDINRFELIGGCICGFILAMATFLQQSGINAGTDAGKASFITALYVVLVPIYSILMKKKVRPTLILSVTIATVGFYFLCLSSSFTLLLSDVFVLICALIFPFHILAIDYFSPRCDGIRMSMVQFAAATVTNLIFAVIFERGTEPGVIFASIVPIIFLGIGSSGVAYTLQIIGQRGVNPSAASVLMSLESVFGVLGSAIILGERMSGREYLGCLIVFIAVILSPINVEELILKNKNKENKNV